jgi:hypothetical protein
MNMHHKTKNKNYTKFEQENPIGIPTTCLYALLPKEIKHYWFIS